MNITHHPFIKKSLKVKKSILHDKDLIDVIQGFREVLSFQMLDDIKDGYFSLNEEKGIGVKVMDRWDGFFEIAMLADLHHNDYNSSSFVVIVDELNQGLNKLVYLVEHFDKKLKKLPIDNLGNTIDIPESSFQNKMLNRHLNHLKNCGYKFDRNILKAFEVDILTNSKPHYYLTNLTSQYLLNGSDLFDGATLDGFQQFGYFKEYIDVLLTNRYRLKL